MGTTLRVLSRQCHSRPLPLPAGQHSRTQGVLAPQAQLPRQTTAPEGRRREALAQPAPPETPRGTKRHPRSAKRASRHLSRHQSPSPSFQCPKPLFWGQNHHFWGPSLSFLTQSLSLGPTVSLEGLNPTGGSGRLAKSAQKPMGSQWTQDSQLPLRGWGKACD